MLKDAIKVATEVESALEFSRVKEGGEQEIYSIDKAQQLDNTMEHLVKTVEKMRKKIEKLELQENKSQVETWKCYLCKEVGQLKSRCPLNSQRPARRVTECWPQDN